VFPGTSSAAEIRFECPVCSIKLRDGFGFSTCDCGEGPLKYNVHRTAAVYTPRSVVIVNPPSPERVRELDRAGGPSRALAWTLRGFSGRWVDAASHTKATFRQQLIDQGIAPALADSFVSQAIAAGDVSEDDGGDVDTVPSDVRSVGESQAVDVEMAVAESRLTVADLAEATNEWSTLGILYRSKYSLAQRRVGVEAVDLVDRFPVLTGNYAYTRGNPKPGEARLVPYRNAKNNYVVYADVSETESLFVRLRPTTGAQLLRPRGHDLPAWTEEPTAPLSVLQRARIPAPGEAPDQPTAGSDLLALVHSMSHWVIRRAAVFAGIDRNALGELLVPLHAGFFVYAAARGDFVLGGLQAVFETELDELLADLVTAEHRCPLDPGCARAGAACVACLHLGEPSCRYYNGYLDRRTLFGGTGYVSLASEFSPSPT
jgi:hypothetical protein